MSATLPAQFIQRLADEGDSFRCPLSAMLILCRFPCDDLTFAAADIAHSVALRRRHLAPQLFHVARPYQIAQLATARTSRTRAIVPSGSLLRCWLCRQLCRCLYCLFRHAPPAPFFVPLPFLPVPFTGAPRAIWKTPDSDRRPPMRFFACRLDRPYLCAYSSTRRDAITVLRFGVSGTLMNRMFLSTGKLTMLTRVAQPARQDAGTVRAKQARYQSTS